MKLAKEGYYNGNPELILNAPVDIVMNIMKYESTLNDYLDTYKGLNE